MTTIIEPTQVIVVQQPHSNISVTNNGAIQVQQPNQTKVTVTPGPTQVVDVAVQGPPGPPGSGAVIHGICGVDIALGTVVISSGGLLYPADPTNSTHANFVVGVATVAGLEGQEISVAQAGDISVPVSQDAQYFVGLNGVLSTTTVAPGATWFRYMGLGNAVNSLLVVPTASVFLPA